MNPVAVSVVVSTYQQADNLQVLVPQIAAALTQAERRFEIVIVDDNSPDATAQVCDELAKQFPVRLELRTHERGRSSAVVHGMQQARGDTLVVMDADLSHPPESIPELVKALQLGADFVIGSGSAPGLFRWLKAKAAALPVWPLTSADPLAGFFAMRRDTFLDAEHLDADASMIALELIVKCRCKNVVETPIPLEKGAAGATSVSNSVNYLRHLKRLYEFKYGALARLGQFLLVGGTGMAVDLACYVMLMSLLPLTVARGLAIWVAMTWNFWLNRRFTFSFARRRALLPQYVMFCLTCGVGALVNWTTSIAVASLLTVFVGRPLSAAVVGIVVGSIFNFVLCNCAVFQRSKPVAAAAAPSIETAR